MKRSQGVSNGNCNGPKRTNCAGHGHSHGDVALAGSEEGMVATARGFLVVLALSIHDLFEGVALGVARLVPLHNCCHCQTFTPSVSQVGKQESASLLWAAIVMITPVLT